MTSWIAALKAGHYYTSQGPTHPRHRDRWLRADRLLLPGILDLPDRHRAARSYRAHGQRLVDARFSTDLFEDSYCRITIVDAAGKRAWSNPIWLE